MSEEWLIVVGQRIIQGRNQEVPIKTVCLLNNSIKLQCIDGLPKKTDAMNSLCILYNYVVAIVVQYISKVCFILTSSLIRAELKT